MKLKPFVVAVLIVFLLTVFIFESPLSYLDLKITNFLFFLRGSWKPANEKIVVVAVDDKSLDQSRYGRWSWRREAYADFLKKVIPAKPSVVVFDISFVLPDEYGKEQDVLFESAIHNANNVLLAGYFTKDSFRIKEKPELLVKPLVAFEKAATGVGFVNNIYDPDDQIRWAKLFHRGDENNGMEFSLALKTILHHLGVSEENVAITSAGLKIPWMQDIDVPLDQAGYMNINYSGPVGHFETVSFTDVLSGSVQSDIFKDKIVLIGVTAPVLHDDHLTPLAAGARPGVEVLADIIRTILERRFLKAVPALYFNILFLALLAGSGFVFFFLSPRYNWLVLILLVVSLFSLAYALFLKGLMLPLARPLAALAVLYPTGLALQFAGERKRRLAIRQAFQHYVSPEIVKKISEDPELLKLGGEKRGVTLLFSDVAGFTAVSESTTPEELVKWLNEYMDEMSSIILDHGGTIDKYIGDAMMVFWNAPLDQPDHAVRACQAALKMQQRLSELNNAWEKEGRPRLDTRIGLNTGAVIVGNMGSSKRFDYTVLGDNVNLASRLEGINKYYGTSIMISFSTFLLAGEFVKARQLDYIKVKGKTEPVAILELLGGKGPLSKEQEILAGMFERALHHYRLGNWDKSIECFSTLTEKFPDDKASRVLLFRCRELKADPPDGWDGVYIFDAK